MGPTVMFSVIIPVYNAERYIGHQLHQLEQQSFTGEWELIVADNGSTDSTLEIVKTFEGRVPELRIVDARRRQGAGAARNTAAEVAAGEYLLFADADDLVSTDWIAAYAAASSSADFATGPNIIFPDGDPVPDLAQPFPYELPIYLNWKPAALGCNFAMRRSVYRKFGGFDEDFLNAQDVEFSWRAQLAGISLHLVPEARIAKRQRDTLRSKFQQHRGFGAADLALQRKYASAGFQERKNLTLRRVAWSVLHLPYLLWPRKRIRWAAVAGRAFGRIEASLRSR